MAFASGSRLAYKPYMQLPVTPPQCLDCNIPPECGEPNCLTDVVLTAQCTDQCVVIACSDPNHALSICDKEGPHNHCDLVCDETTDCTDCHGFDAFVGYSAIVPREFISFFFFIT